MNPVGGSYDESLLREAPAATREQLQEGYNPDLLIAPTRNKSVRQQSPLQSTPPGAAPPALPGFSHGSGMAQANAVGRSFNSYDLLNEKPPEGSRSTSFWGSTTGRIVIGIIVALVIIGAVVGGAVGGTVGKKKTSSLAASSPSSSSTSPTAAQVVGDSSSASATVTAGFPSISITLSTEPTTKFTFPFSESSQTVGGLGAFANEVGSNPTVLPAP